MAQKQGFMLTVRHTTYMVCKLYRMSGSCVSLADITELGVVRVKCGDVKACVYDWGMRRNGMAQHPADKLLENLA